MRKICLLGATGSIGTSTIDIVKRFPKKYQLVSVSAHANVEKLYAIAKDLHPKFVGVTKNVDAEWRQKFEKLGATLFSGPDAAEQLAEIDEYNVLVNAIVGAAGLKPTLKAIELKKTIALANKETLVTAGELVTRRARENGVAIIPIDSEHSALWQCLVGERFQDVERLILTASGGPFRETSRETFRDITVEQALNHPNWDMGPKITIDSATLMNKGLEVIEAFWLFNVPIDRVSVVVHPQSIIHSMVEFVDSSIKAQLGLPDMRVPIQYALSYPERLPNDLPRLNFFKFHTLNFMEPDFEKFRCLKLAFESIGEGGTAPAVLNAANEEAVFAFLDRQIRFDQIPNLVEEALDQHDNHKDVTLENVLFSDKWARDFVKAKK